MVFFRARVSVYRVALHLVSDPCKIIRASLQRTRDSPFNMSSPHPPAARRVSRVPPGLFVFPLIEGVLGLRVGRMWR